MKPIVLLALAACTLATGCMSYSDRTVVEKPVPARTVYADPAPATTTTTVYTTR